MSPAYTASSWIEHRAWRASRRAAGAANHERPLGAEIPFDCSAHPINSSQVPCILTNCPISTRQYGCNRRLHKANLLPVPDGNSPEPPIETARQAIGRIDATFPGWSAVRAALRGACSSSGNGSGRSPPA